MVVFMGRLLQKLREDNKSIFDNLRFIRNNIYAVGCQLKNHCNANLLQEDIDKLNEIQNSLVELEHSILPKISEEQASEDNK